MVKWFKELEIGLKLTIILVFILFIVVCCEAVNKQSKIKDANIEIETRDYIFYSYKETIKINPNSLCINFYNLAKEYNMEHCGEFTVKYIK